MHKNYNIVPERPQFDPDVYGNAMNNRVPVFSTLGRGPKGKDGEKGEKGDPMTIEDMSAEQLQQLIDDIRAEITTRMANIKDVTVYTDGVNTTVFDLTDIFPNWAMEYLVFVNVEGLDLSYGTDYTIVGDQLTLTNPIVHDHTRVDFRFLYFEFINDTNSYAYIMSLIGSMPTPDYNITDALETFDGRITATENALPIEDFDSTNTVSQAIANTLAKLPGTAFNSSNTVKDAIDDLLGKLPGTAFDSTNTVAKAIQNRGAFQNANIMCVYDSWGNDNTYGVTYPYLKQVCDNLKANYIDLHQGSTGFCAAPSYLTRVQAWCAANPNAVETVNYMFVQGSINDYTFSESDISSAVVTFMNWVSANMPNTTVIFLPTFMPKDANMGSVAINDYNMWQRCYRGNAIAWLNNKMPCIIIPDLVLALSSIMANVMYNDIHPNQLGHNILAKYVTGKLNGASFTKNLATGGTSLAIILNFIYFTDRNGNEMTPQGGCAKIWLDGAFLRFKGHFEFDATSENTSSVNINFKNLPALNINDLPSTVFYNVSTYNSLSTGTASGSWSGIGDINISQKTYNTTGTHSQFSAGVRTDRILTSTTPFMIDVEVVYPILYGLS